jgi:hypothetical protein
MLTLGESDFISKINIRNTNYNTIPPSNYYTENEINEMIKNLRISQCPTCFEKINDTNNCFLCKNGHKFHKICDNMNTASPVNLCPKCEDINMYKCDNVFDLLQ